MILLQPLRWCCVDCVIHHEQVVRKEQKYMYVAWTSNNRVISMEWSWWVTSNNACEPGEQLIVLANGDDESDLVRWSLLLLAATVRSFVHMPLGIPIAKNGAVTMMWRSNGVQPPHKERAIGAVCCKKEGMLLQSLRWCCVDCVIHHERGVHEEQHQRYMWCELATKEWSWRASSADINLWTITTSVRGEWSWHVNSIVACCHSAKLCAHAAQDFWSQQRAGLKKNICLRSTGR